MQTQYIRSRESASDYPPKHLTPHVNLNPVFERPKRTFNPPPMAAAKAGNSEFSPLIQEFLDECGYSDR